MKENNIKLFEKSLRDILDIYFNKTKREDFFIRKKVKSNIKDYKQTTPILEQIKYLQNQHGIEIEQYVNYTFYNRIFEFDFNVKESRLKKKDMSITTNRTKYEKLIQKKKCFVNVQFDPSKPIIDEKLKHFLLTDGKMSTVLVEELYQIYTLKYDNLLVDKRRVFFLDLFNILSKFENSLQNIEQKNAFSSLWQQIINEYLFISNTNCSLKRKYSCTNDTMKQTKIQMFFSKKN